ARGGSGQAPAAPRGAAAPQPANAPRQGEGETSSELQVELYNTLRSLLASRHGGETYESMEGGGGGSVGGHGTGLGPAELLSALTILQSQSAVMQARAES